MINGAFDDSPDWLNPDSDFAKAVSATFGEQATPWRWSGFGVTAASGYAGIIGAGYDLASFINTYQFKPDEKLNIVAFSDGGNVAKVASRDGFNHPIDNLVTLATPQNLDLPFINTSAVKNYCNVSNSWDLVQFAGAAPWQIYGFADMESIAADWSWAAIDDLRNGDPFMALVDSARAAEYQGYAAAFWLSTKFDVYADHNVFVDSGSHFSLHTAPLWNSITKPCSLRSPVSVSGLPSRVSVH
jgi:hypothetical protein